MEQLEQITDTASNWFDTLFTTEIYNGQSFADLLTFEALLGLAGNVLAATAIILLGFVISGVLRRRIHKIGENHESLDNPLFSFLANIVRYVV